MRTKFLVEIAEKELKDIKHETLKYAGKQTWKNPSLYLLKNTKNKQNNAYINPIHKKGSKKAIRKYCPISLRAQNYKILTEIIKPKMKNTLDAAQRADFRWGFNTIDHIRNLSKDMSPAKQYKL